MTGMFSNDCATIGKNCPKRYIRPYSWHIMPMTGHLSMTKTMPPKNDTMPRNLSGLAKNRIVLDTPMVSVNPVRNRTSPSASKVESNKKSTPKKRKPHPYDRSTKQRHVT